MSNKRRKTDVPKGDAGGKRQIHPYVAVKRSKAKTKRKGGESRMKAKGFVRLEGQVGEGKGGTNLFGKRIPGGKRGRHELSHYTVSKGTAFCRVCSTEASDGEERGDLSEGEEGELIFFDLQKDGNMEVPCAGRGNRRDSREKGREARERSPASSSWRKEPCAQKGRANLRKLKPKKAIKKKKSLGGAVSLLRRYWKRADTKRGTGEKRKKSGKCLLEESRNKGGFS